MEQSAATSEPATPSTPVGDNGAPDVDAEAGVGPSTTTPSVTSDDWRIALAGDDDSFAEDLEGYESLAAVGTLLREQREALSERPKVPTLPDDATEEQIAEHRALTGVPEFSGDYEYDLPEDYTPSEFEQELAGDFLEHMHGKHVPAPVVKETMEFFYRAQQASERAATAIDVEKQQEWQGHLQSKLGDDYETALADGEAYVNKVFEGDPDAKHELLNFRGPDGGRLGDHPLFVEWAIERARAGRAATREGAPSTQQTPPAGTQPQQRPASLAARQEQLEKLMFTDRRTYDSPETKAELEGIIERRMELGELNWMGEPVKKRKVAQ
jgi:hypothetical protein